MTVPKVFVDTNVLVYTVSRGVDDQKQVSATNAVTGLLRAGAATISPQVIGEFLNVTRRAPYNWMTPEEARERAAEFVQGMYMSDLDEQTTHEALRACGRYHLHYWDAQIWAAARMSGCDIILTEDTHGNEIEGVRYVNPFEAGFDVKALLLI